MGLHGMYKYLGNNNGIFVSNNNHFPEILHGIYGPAISIMIGNWA